MGVTGVLGRAVFAKSRSFCAPHEQQHHIHNKNGIGKRWSRSVRSCLCGHELLLDSVLAEEDSASSVNPFISGRSSEATVTQPMLTPELTNVSVDDEEDQRLKEEAAIRIQSAFRHYMARFNESAKAERSSCNAEELIDADKESRYEESESVCTSLEVQTANSVNILSLTRKAKEQPLKFKEEWDDSTVSSNISKMRMQNRMEAMTRRERALAYAFSQQLRICSKKRGSKSASDDVETSNMRWNWLERWMATRMSDKDDFHSTKLQTKKPSTPESVKSLEKESCGSNEVFHRFSGSFTVKSPTSLHTQKSVMKAKRSVSKRKTVPS